MKTTDKTKLIELILKRIFNDSAKTSNIIFENPQKVSFTRPLASGIEKRFFLVWTNELNFEVWHTIGKRNKEYKIPTSAWFKVRDLLRENYLAAEKLKHNAHGMG